VSRRTWRAVMPWTPRPDTPRHAPPPPHAPPPDTDRAPVAPAASARMVQAALPPRDAPGPRTRVRPRAAPDPGLKAGDVRYLDAVTEAQVVQARFAANAAIGLMVLAVAGAVTWAATTRVEEITRTDARVVPDGREQVIASLEGGILRELTVREGDRVTAGQTLARLDPTRFEAQQAEARAKRLALMGTIARLRAEVDGDVAPRFPPEVAGEDRVVRAELEAFGARRRLLEEAMSANRQSIRLVQSELDVAERMSAQGLMSNVEVMRLRRQINDMQQQTLERRNRFRQDASTELLRAQTELAQLDEQLVARDDTVRRTVLQSPVDGLVKNIRVNTLGGVVAGGAPIMEIVPVGRRLLVEAKVKPADIGFVRVGQAATMKLSAYEFNVYGGLVGTVESISPDALGDPDRPNAGPDATWYRALVRVESADISRRGEPLPVIPGMTGTVEINTGQRSVLDYLLRPLMKAREAFRER
jgi:membrane fusion protein, adhesin transport system